jgi:3-oxoacyl-[acyl-carrier protein] reductase
MSGVRLCRVYLKRMLEHDRGNIVFISSEAAYSIKEFMIQKTAQVAIARGLAQLCRNTKNAGFGFLSSNG